MIIYGGQQDYPESEQFNEEEYESSIELQEYADEEKRQYMKEINDYD